MDPTENLKSQIETASAIIHSWNRYPRGEGLPYLRAEKIAEMADDLADLVLDLHKWISNGGALPEQWKNRSAQ